MLDVAVSGLGWVLSDESMTEMDKALVDQDAVCQLSVFMYAQL